MFCQQSVNIKQHDKDFSRKADTKKIIGYHAGRD